ncbi:hypothetical protein NPX13_g8601 [Xylaria arbuscula]|uniref:Heterokaryon incompatibility domain-containing protein n=1 Tax=Xylaria arbuscula TaxID=114810 RepID=A0A9W8TIG2_9PEZI|nr:hypothetical protein NPX13_g8601 [Xylaria arbuscula]
MHFNFSRPNTIKSFLDIKKDAIKGAKAAGLEKALVQNLQLEFKRYRNATKHTTSDVIMPCPTNLDDPNEYKLSTHRACINVWLSWDDHKLNDLVAAAVSENCRMCQAIVDMVEYATNGEAPGQSIVSSCLFLNNATCRPEMIGISIYPKGSTSIDLQFHIAMENANLQSDIVLKTPVVASTGDEVCLNFCSRALQACLTQHETCRPDDKNLWLPTRLIDLHPNLTAKGEVRVIQTNDLPDIERHSGVQYLTLSHTWGPVGPTKLTRSKLKCMEEGIKIVDLSRRFQDAIYVAQRLEIRFLWIDSLCIIQDSLDDRAKECSDMDKVYRHGVCNISACLGEDSTVSLFTTRQPPSGTPIIFMQNYSNCVARLSVIPDYVSLTRKYSQLYTRGWVLQERLLSPRILHFAHFLSWECHSCLTTEMYDESVTRNKLLLPWLPVSERGWISGTRAAGVHYAYRWWKMLQIYTRSNLTYQNDKLIALSGIAREFSKLIDEPYYAGVWGGDYAVFSLLWHSLPQRPVVAIPQSEYRAPSWSWASTEGTCYELTVPTVAELA